MSSGSNNFVIGKGYVLTFIGSYESILTKSVIYTGRGYYLPGPGLNRIESKDGKHLFEDIDIGDRPLFDWELEEEQIISYEEIE